MKFLKRNKKAKKIILVISDLHLGAGEEVDGRKNVLEDFHSGSELISFLEYYSSKEYQNKEIELIINGDFLDFLAVPYVKYFDDEYWSEKAALEKLEIIIKAHPEIFKALEAFLQQKNKSILYIIGNHDAELIFDSMKKRFISEFSDEVKSKIKIENIKGQHLAAPGIYIEHGHDYEELHQFDEKEAIMESNNGEKYFIPPWGSYFVTHVMNKYMQEREHLNSVRPIKSFLIHGLIFDTFFIMRFMIANAYFYFMVRFMRYYRAKQGWKKIIEDTLNELTLFQDYESLTRNFFSENKDSKVLIVGHTHEPLYREYDDGTIFINTGTWTKMVSLDLTHEQNGVPRTYAKILIYDSNYNIDDFNKHVTVDLLRWSPRSSLPYESFK